MFSNTFNSYHIVILLFSQLFFFSCNMIPLVGSFQTTTDSFSNNDYVACVLE